MATVSSARASSPVPNPFNGSALAANYGTYEIAAALSGDDLIEFCAIPAGATVVGGWLSGDDIDTGTEALEIDVGDGTDADLYLDSGVITGDAVTDLLPTYASAAMFYRPFNGILKNGPQVPSADSTDDTISKVIGTVTAAANAGGTGTVNCTILYLAP